MKKWFAVLMLCGICFQASFAGLRALGPTESSNAYCVSYYYDNCYSHSDHWEGNTQVISEALHVAVSPAYLDIEDEVFLAPVLDGNWGSPHDSIFSKLRIAGSFSLPDGAVIEGALAWNGAQILQAKIRPKGVTQSVYDSLIQRDTVSASPAEQLLLIEQVSGNNYNLTLNSVTWGGTKRLRIRYLLFNGFSDNGFKTALIPLGSAFGAALPSQFRVDMQGSDGIQAIKLERDNSAFIKNLPSTVFCDNSGSSYYIQSSQFASPLFANTGFSSGDWAGDYMIFWGGIPESLQVYAGLRTEVVFLWKWIEAGSFVHWDGGSKTISDYGQMAVYQAGSIRQATNDIVQGPAKVGMLLDKGDSNYTIFPLCTRGSKNLDTLLGFLDRFDEQYVLNSIAGDEFSTPGKIDTVSFRKKYAKEFSISLQKVFSLYSPSQKVVKHLIVVTVGPHLTSETPQSAFPDYIQPDYFNGITVGSYGMNRYWNNCGTGCGWYSISTDAGYWPGVPLFRFTADRSLQSETYHSNSNWFNFAIPAFKTANFSVTLKSQNHNYNYDLVSGQTSDSKPAFPWFHFAGHAIGDWDTTLYWTAVNQDGDSLAAFAQKPSVLRYLNDTGLVKLWAGSLDALSEVYKRGNLGEVYGIVSPEYSLSAIATDTVSSALRATLNDSGVPVLSGKDVYVFKNPPGPAIESAIGTGHDYALTVYPDPFNPTTKIVFYLPVKGFVILHVYDITGREIALLLNEVCSAGRHSVPFNANILPSGVYICKLEVMGKVLIHRMVLLK